MELLMQPLDIVSFLKDFLDTTQNTKNAIPESPVCNETNSDSWLTVPSNSYTDLKTCFETTLLHLKEIKRCFHDLKSFLVIQINLQTSD